MARNRLSVLAGFCFQAELGSAKGDPLLCRSQKIPAFETQEGSATAFIRSALGISQEYPLTIDAAAPGIFQTDGIRTVATTSLGALITPGNPAVAGSMIVVYLTGIGTVTTIPRDGDRAPPLARATLPATASIGGVNAPLQFLGLTPYFVGLAQANLQVPQPCAHLDIWLSRVQAVACRG